MFFYPFLRSFLPLYVCIHFSVSTVTCTFVTCYIKYQSINQSAWRVPCPGFVHEIAPEFTVGEGAPRCIHSRDAPCVKFAYLLLQQGTTFTGWNLGHISKSYSRLKFWYDLWYWHWCTNDKTFLKRSASWRRSPKCTVRQILVRFLRYARTKPWSGNGGFVLKRDNRAQAYLIRFSFRRSKTFLQIARLSFGSSHINLL